MNNSDDYSHGSIDIYDNSNDRCHKPDNTKPCHNCCNVCSKCYYRNMWWFLQSSKRGEPGPPGPRGPAGSQGKQGEPGVCECNLDEINAKLNEIIQEIKSIETFIYETEIIEIMSSNSALKKLGVAIIHIGHTYNIWGIGKLDHVQTFTNGVTYRLISQEELPVLANYTMDTTISTMWIETPNGNIYDLPIRFDATGIYFTPGTQLSNIPVGSTFKFTQSLILVIPKEERLSRV